jgi:hypothetical protein
MMTLVFEVWFKLAGQATLVVNIRMNTPIFLIINVHDEGKLYIIPKGIFILVSDVLLPTCRP